MKAWILQKPRQLVLESIPVPEPNDTEVLVRVDAACICNGSDPGIYFGHEAYQTPLVFGHEASGIIVKAGKHVTGFQVGDRVAWWFAAGAFAEFQTVSPYQTAMFRVPDSVTIEEAPVLELVIAACRALMQVSTDVWGKRLTICGLGPSGLVLLQYARLLGFEHITGWDLYESRRQLALSLGADEVYDPRTLPGGTASMGPETDVAVDMMGDDKLPGEPTITALMRTVRQDGLFITYGHPEHGRHFNPYVFQSRNLRMQGPVNDLNIIREKGQAVMQAVAEGKIKIAPLITHVTAFENLNTVFGHLLEKPEDQIKVILKWNANV